MPVVTIPYAPRPAFVPFHRREQREAVVVCHRRAGKTVALVNDTIKRSLSVSRKFPPPRHALFYPTRVRAKDIAWSYLKHYTESIPNVRVNETDLSVLLPGDRAITLYGADNSRGVGLYLDGAVFDEADDIPHGVVSEVLPALSDYQGYTVYSGMLKGRHNLFKRFEAAQGDSNVFSMLLRASQSGILPPEELAILRAGMSEAAYEMQVECNVNASIAHAIYGREMDKIRADGRMGRVAWEPGLPLHFYADIGHSLTGDDWSFWGVQLSGREILLQTYLAKTGEVPAYYAAQLIRTWDSLNMAQGTVYLPHDGSRKDRQGRTAEDDLRSAGIKRVEVVPRTPNVWDSINHLRVLLGRVRINQERCGEGWKLGEREMPSGIDCLDYYSKKLGVSSGIPSDVPVHDEYSHGADALRTFAEAHRQGLIEGSSEARVFENRGVTRFREMTSVLGHRNSRLPWSTGLARRG